MSKCDFEIEFDRPDRVYKSGDVVKGVVRIRVNQDVYCRGLRIGGVWKTHGRGNRASSEYFTTNVHQGDLSAGQSYEFPFEFPAASHPWTYRGNYLNIDHYVTVRIDVPWAFDPKHETEFVVQPSASATLPEVVTESAGKSTGKAGRVIATLVAVVFIAVGIPLTFAMGFGCIFVGVGGVILFFLYRNVLAQRKVGNVDLRIDPLSASPGGWINVHLSFVPKSSGTLNRAVFTLRGQEIVVSGSGTNRTTHTHKIHEEEISCLRDHQMSSGQEVSVVEQIQVPQSHAYSTAMSDNKIVWTISARLDIPRWPDWMDQREFTLAPAVCLGATPPPSKSTTDFQSTRKPIESPAPVTAIPEREPTPPPLALEPDPWKSEPEPASETVEPFEVSNETGGKSPESVTSPDLLELTRQLCESDRFGSERQALIDERKGQFFQAEVVVERSSYTYGVFDEPEYRSGQTLQGTIKGTEQRISIQLPESDNELVSDARSGDTWLVNGKIVKWDDLFNRIELRGTRID